LKSFSPRLSWVAPGLLLALVALYPWYESQIGNREPLPSPLAQIRVPTGWQPASEAVTAWTPHWEGLDDRKILHLQRGSDRIMVYLGWYGAQRSGAELVSTYNQLVPLADTVQTDNIWRKVRESSRDVEIGGNTLSLREGIVSAPATGKQLMVWYWDRVDGMATTSAIRIKLALGLRKLLGADDAGAVVIIATPFQDRPEQAEALLQRFAADFLPTMNPVLDHRDP